MQGTRKTRMQRGEACHPLAMAAPTVWAIDPDAWWPFAVGADARRAALIVRLHSEQPSLIERRQRARDVRVGVPRVSRAVERIDAATLGGPDPLIGIDAAHVAPQAARFGVSSQLHRLRAELPRIAAADEQRADFLPWDVADRHAILRDERRHEADAANQL